jgi:hypothetical protein
MAKYTIRRGTRKRNIFGSRMWYFWSCELCGSELDYLNQSAMVIGSQAHKDNHMEAKEKIKGIEFKDST